MEVTYELYIQEKGRWIIDSRYKAKEREKAIDEAKHLAKQSHIQATKVVRESYDSSEQVAREKTIFESHPEESRGSGAVLGGGGTFDGGFDGGFDYDAILAADGSDYDVEAEAAAGSRATRRGGRRGQRAQSRGQGRRTAAGGQDRSVVGRSVRHPAALLLYKFSVIAIVSFGFAAVTTYIYAQIVL